VGVYVKDLRIIKDRKLKDILIVDNSILSFAFQLDNGIPIKSYNRQDGDEELLYMVSFLEEIVSYQDVRHHIRNTFRISSIMNRFCKSSV
jgi:CTD small phosphatase-like protein 2